MQLVGGAWWWAPLLLVAGAVMVGGAESQGSLERVMALKVHDVEKLKPGETPKKYRLMRTAAGNQSEVYGYTGNKPVQEGSVEETDDAEKYERDHHLPTSNLGYKKEPPEYARNEVDSEQPGEMKNNVALVTWTQADETYNPDQKYVTVGALIATNAIVTAPSAKVPVKSDNTSNWNVHQVEFKHPSNVIDAKNLMVIFHPNFTVDRDGTRRIALIMILSDGEHATKELIPFAMVGAPFLPSDQVTRHDDYGLASCVMFTPNDAGDDITRVKMSAVICRHGTKARRVFEDRLCGYPKMLKHEPAALMVDAVAYPRELGSPLICGNLLMGVYAGVQNLRGTYHKDLGEERDESIQLGGRRLGSEDQYTFDIPGAPRNYDFLSAFVNEEDRKMRWEQSLNVKLTAECPKVSPREQLDMTQKGGDRSSDESDEADEGEESARSDDGEEPSQDATESAVEETSAK